MTSSDKPTPETEYETLLLDALRKIAAKKGHSNLWVNGQWFDFQNAGSSRMYQVQTQDDNFTEAHLTHDEMMENSHAYFLYQGEYHYLVYQD